MGGESAVANGFKLSPQQKHLWLLQQTATEGQPFRVQGSIQIEGALSPERLRAAIEETVRRHEILRTCFTSVAGMRLSVQRVQDEAQIGWREHDLSDLAPQAQAAEIATLTHALSHERIDFARCPLLLTWLVKQSSHKHLLLLSLPALCADGVTLTNLLHEIGQAYTGEEAAEEPIQYADIAEVFNDLLESEETEAGREYWRKQDISAPSQFPFAKELAQPTLFDPHTLPIPLTAETASSLEVLADAQESSLAVVLLAAWQILIARLIGEQEIVVGAAYEGRGYEGLESALGLFARYLPIHSTLEMQRPFPDFLAQVNERVDEIFEWQDYFTLELVRGLTGNERWTPFLPFQFEFAEEPEPYSDGEITFSLVAQQSCTERFRVKVSARAGAEGLELTLHYNASLYSLARMQRLTSQFVTLLDSIVLEPEQPIGDLNLVSEGEREELLTQMYRTGIPYPTEYCIPELFTEQAQRTPERVALSIQGQQLTFAELEARANQLAHYLRSLGVGPEKRVGLYGTRSIEIMVGLLAILKAGGAYVAIDPIYPLERLAYILEDTQAVALVTQESLRTTIPANQGNVVYVDRDAGTIATFPQTPPEVLLHPENLAYLIYTSGSTGRPKGVMVQHRSVMNLSTALHEAVYQELGEGLRVSLNAPLVFDGSVKQWIQLLRGHTICLVPEEVRADAEKLIRFIQEEKLDVLDCTPSMMRLLLAAGFAERVAPKALLLGGEAVDEGLWGQLLEIENTRFFNLYGPTESTVDATTCWVQQAPTLPVIGRPLDNISLYILDQKQRLVPHGAPGEIYLGGAGLARGYIGQPAMTAQRFVPDPFGRESGTRLYRTGDVGRWLEDGTVEYRGRIDHQIQLHGIRVELGEIETVLCDHPAVSGGVVVVRETGDGEQHLAAYYVPKTSENDNPALLQQALRDFLRAKLPEYMIPRFFVPLPEFPLTRNGKVDRQALPDPELYAAAVSTVYVAPRNDVERTIAAIWQEVLGVEKVGIHDNFFDLGGHSLMLVQAFDRLRGAFNREFPLVEMYRHPTISALTDYLQAAPIEPAPSQKIQDRVKKQGEALQRQRQAMKKGEK